MLYLVRHGQSFGNVDHNVYNKVPNDKIELTQKGIQQAIKAGEKILDDINADRFGAAEVGARLGPKDISVIKSPFKRTMQTAECIVNVLKTAWTVKESIDYRIVEQLAGNFVDATEQWDARRAEYGKFYYTIPNGESGYDCLLRQIPFAELLRNLKIHSNHVAVIGHSRQIRVLRMLLENKTPDWFEKENNFPNGTVFRYHTLGVEPTLL